MKFSNRTLAVVLASSFLVGKACEYLVKWSVITSTFSNPPLDLSKVRKSIQTNSIGCVLTIFISSALRPGFDFLKVHRLQDLTLSLTIVCAKRIGIEPKIWSYHDPDDLTHHAVSEHHFANA